MGLEKRVETLEKKEDESMINQQANQLSGTIITLTCESDKKEEGLDRLLTIIKKAESEVEEKKGLKILTSTEVSKHDKLHHHVYMNRKINIDIKKEWQLGQSFIEHIETADQCQSVITYLCR